MGASPFRLFNFDFLILNYLGNKALIFIFATPQTEANTVRCLSGRKERFAKPSYG